MPAAVDPPPLLSGLARLLFRAPPRLTGLMEFLRHTDDYNWFTDLVNRLLPNQVEQILADPNIPGQVLAFASGFEEKYFPLASGYIEYLTESEEEPPWTALRRGIPFDLFGLGYETLHELWYVSREGLAAMALFSTPSDLEEGYWQQQVEGLRVSWMETAADHMPISVIHKIPAGGVPTGHLVRAVKGTRFEALGQAAQWVWGESNNLFLDYSFEDGALENGYADPWTDEVLAEGHGQWTPAHQLMDSVDEMCTWLEQDLGANFEEMIEFVLPLLDNVTEETEDDERSQ